MSSPQLRSADVLICCKLFSFACSKQSWSYPRLAAEVGLSSAGVYGSVRRCREAGLLGGEGGGSNGDIKVVKAKLVELLTKGVPAMFFAKRGEIALGLSTALGAAPCDQLAEKLGWKPDPLPLVWPHPKGTTRGETLYPLHGKVPEAAMKDVLVYELLALVDVIRVGGSKERKLATEAIAGLMG
jgi:hypothetical protein